MKKLLSFVLCLAMLFTTVSALADYSIALKGDGITLLQDEKDRKIKMQGQKKDGTFPENPIIEGQSSTTGLPWTGRYMPVIVQIGTDEGGLGARAPWGGQYADIVYEQPLYRNGTHRISFLFSDNMPTSTGPVRSARFGHIYLREEWGGPIVFHGGPEEKGNNILKLIKDLGASKKGVIFNANSSATWRGKLHYGYRLDGSDGTPKIAAPNNFTVNPAGIQSLVDEKLKTPNHTFLFTDESPYTGPLAYTINIDCGHPVYVSHFYYDEMENLYYRYVQDQPYVSFVDENNRKETVPMSFSNLIVQRVHMDYANNNGVMPILKNIDQGNADIFIGGRYIAGYWIRTGVDQRTIFFDSEGKELVLTRGKTFIAMVPKEHAVTYTAE